MLRRKYEFDKEFSILIELIGEMDDFIFKIDKILSDEQNKLRDEFSILRKYLLPKKLSVYLNLIQI